jgi:triphosphoribosyl-dephospho-CoA synthetase
MRRGENAGGVIVGKKQSAGGVMALDRKQEAREAQLHALGEFGVEWGFENASRFSLIFLKDLPGRIEAACRHNEPLTEAALERLLPETSPRDLQALLRRVSQSAARISGPQSESECGRQLLQSVFVGMQKFWNEIERDMESA